MEVKVDLHAKMDEYKVNYPDELQLFYEEERNKEEIARLKRTNRDLKDELKEANIKREAVRSELITLDEKINVHQQDYDNIMENLESATLVGEGEIEKMEGYINKKAHEYDAPTLPALIDLVCQDKFCYSTSNKILANQVKIVEKEAEDMNIRYEDQIDEIKKEISELKEAINILKPKLRKIEETRGEEKSTDQVQREDLVVSKFKAKAARLKECLEELRESKLELRTRQTVFDQWLLKKKAFLAKEEEDKIESEELCISDLDNSILESFLKNTLYKIEDFGSKKKLEEMLGFYIDKVARREKVIQKCYNDSLEVKAVLDESQKNLKEIQIPDQEYHSIKNELKQVTTREKAIELLIEERRAQLEFEILKQGEENFELYLESNASVFTNVKKTYGSKISEKMKSEQKQEFIDMIRNQYQKRYDEIKETHFKILDIDKKLDECDKLIKEEVPKNQRNAEQEKDKLERRLISMNQQHQAFEETEKECIEICEELLAKKKEEIYHESNEVYRDNNFDNVQTRLQEVIELILSKEKTIEKNKRVIEETDAGMFDRNTKYAAEIAQMRTRIDNLKKGQKEIKNTVRPQLQNLRREIKELSHEIIIGKKKMEGIEDQIHKTEKGLDLAKEAYYEKFNMNPDEVTGSPVKKTQFEYTKEYEKLKSLEPEEFRFEDETENYNLEENPDEEMQLEEEVVVEEDSRVKKKKVESVSLDLAELVSMSLKAKQEENKEMEIEEENDEDLVHIALMNNPTKLKINIKFLSEKDVEFLESIRPLLEGKEIFKKFSTSSSISQVPYNPFNNKKPERCGFGRRLIRLNPENIEQVFIVNKLDIRKNGYYIERRGNLENFNHFRKEKSI